MGATQTVSVQDGQIAAAWGMTAWAWAALSNTERADLRNRVVFAPNFSAVMGR